MEFNELVEAWLVHNIYGEGKEHQKAGNYWFRGPIFYYETTAQWRLVPGKHKDWAWLWRGMGNHLAKDSRWHTKMNIVRTPDIGVFSRYDQDWLDHGDELNARVRFVMLQRVRQLALEETIGMNALKLTNEKDALVKRMKSYYSEYDYYNEQVGAYWDDLPTMYGDKLISSIEDRVRVYNHPASVAARERSRARKKAVEALGLNTK
jgi:hypothetical protein